MTAIGLSTGAMVPAILTTRGRTSSAPPRNDDFTPHWVRRKAGPFFIEGINMSRSIVDLTEALAREAEIVCRYYLSNGHREGGYWMVGDARNTPGRSLFVRLKGPLSGKGAAGKWTDAATGEHGDLLDIIRETCSFVDFADIAQEARRFLSLPPPERPSDIASRFDPSPAGSPKAARRLFAMSQPIAGTLAEAYLRNRGLAALSKTASLRFHPRCYYRPDQHSETETWPALVASVTDLDGAITGAHRTWLDPKGFSDANLGKAPIDTPRRAMGNLLGHAVRFGTAQDVMAASEGIETMLSLKTALSDLPMAAGLSATHLAAIQFPPSLRRLYIVRDNDPAGGSAMARLTQRAGDAGIEAIPLSPHLGDFNDDLRLLGIDALRDALRVQIAPEDVARFMNSAALTANDAASS